MNDWIAFVGAFFILPSVCCAWILWISLRIIPRSPRRQDTARVSDRESSFVNTNMHLTAWLAALDSKEAALKDVSDRWDEGTKAIVDAVLEWTSEKRQKQAPSEHRGSEVVLEALNAKKD